MRYYAIPTKNGTTPEQALDERSERMGTEGTLYGDYKSLANAIRYNFRHNAKPGTIYRVSTKSDRGWKFIGLHY